MYHITKEIVLAFVAGAVTDPKLCAAIEEARMTDPQVQYWIDLLDPDFEDETAPLSLDWAACVSDLIASGQPANQTAVKNIPSKHLLQDDHGTLIYREPVLSMGGDHDPLSVPPPDVPCIFPDYVSGRLKIRQALDRVPSGVVMVTVVRLRGKNDVERLPPVRIELKRATPRKGEPYWEAGVPLNSLIEDLRPGDDFIYCVEAAPGA